MPERRQVSLFRNGRNQAVRIPVEFELPGDTAFVSREGDRLIIESGPKTSFADYLDYLATLDCLEEDFPPRDEGVGPLREIDL